MLRSFASPCFRENCPWWHNENLRCEGNPILASTRTHYFGDLHNHILLYCGDRRIYLSHLQEKMSCRDWGKKGVGVGNRLSVDYCADGNVWYVYIDAEYYDTWDGEKIGKLVQKYGYKFDQAKRDTEIAAKETAEKEFEGSTEDKNLEVDVIDGAYLLQYGTRQIFASTLVQRITSKDYSTAGIGLGDAWDIYYG